jgi:hypothetical protein
MVNSALTNFNLSSRKELATKEDIQNLANAVKEDFQNLSSATREDIQGINADMMRLENKMITWFI